MGSYPLYLGVWIAPPCSIPSRASDKLQDRKDLKQNTGRIGEPLFRCRTATGANDPKPVGTMGLHWNVPFKTRTTTFSGVKSLQISQQIMKIPDFVFQSPVHPRNITRATTPFGFLANPRTTSGNFARGGRPRFDPLCNGSTVNVC